MEVGSYWQSSFSSVGTVFYQNNSGYYGGRALRVILPAEPPEPETFEAYIHYAAFSYSTVYIVLGTGLFTPNIYVGLLDVDVPAHSYLRWTNVTVPQGATVNSAWIEFQAKENDSDFLTIKMYCFDEDNAAALYNGVDPFEANSRSCTSAYLSISIPSWTQSSLYKLTNLQAPIQEVFDRPGWSSGNALAVALKYDTGSSSYPKREAWGGASSGEITPKLFINYTP